MLMKEFACLAADGFQLQKPLFRWQGHAPGTLIPVQFV